MAQLRLRRHAGRPAAPGLPSRVLCLLVVLPVLATLGAVAAPAPVTAAARSGVVPTVHQGYVALGDSYSSGEGTEVYDPATDRLRDRCHRSPIAYAALLSSTRPHLQPLSFVACSGAVTADLYSRNHSYHREVAQLRALTRHTAAVTLTLGGNDVGFADVVSACVHAVARSGYGCSTSAALTRLVSVRTAALAGRGRARGATGAVITPVVVVLGDIARRSPGATIYLAGYPELFGSQRSSFAVDAAAPSGYSCEVNATVNAKIDYADVQWFNRGARRLDRVYQKAVEQARRAGIRATYVSPSPFAGHGLCDRHEPWIQPVLLSATGVRSESLHPTPEGQNAGYRVAFRHAGL